MKTSTTNKYHKGYETISYEKHCIKLANLG